MLGGSFGLVRVALSVRCGRSLRLLATLAVAAAALAGAVTAQARSFVYASDNTDVVDQYSSFAGALTPLSPSTVGFPGSSGGYLIAISPNDRYVYVILDSGGIGTFRVTDNGTLTPVGASTAPTGVDDQDMVVSPDGQSVYVSDGYGGIWQYDVGPNGALTPKTPATVAAANFATGLAVSPDGRTLYATSESCHCAGSVLQYQIGRDGLLSPSSAAPVPTGFDPVDVATTPDGRSVYVSATGEIDQYSAGRHGTLTADTPASVTADGFPQQIAVSPDGRSAYVTIDVGECCNSKDPGVVQQYTVGSGGVLSPKTSATVTAGRLPSGIAIGPNGRRIYVVNGIDNTISQYDVGAGGVLTPGMPATVPTGQGPIGVVVADPGGG